MNAATKKLLKLAIKSATRLQSVFTIPVETASVLANSGLLINKNNHPDELEVYFLGTVQNKEITPFPKLKPENDLYFLLDVVPDRITYTENTQPASNQIGFVEITPETTRAGREYTWETVEVMDVRSCKTTFIKEDSQFLGSYDWIIKRADGTEIFRQNVTPVLSENKTILNLSFDFSSFPSGIYEFSLAESNLWTERFLVDKTGEFKSGSSIVIRIPHPDLLQGYTKQFEFDSDTSEFKNDEFISCFISLM